MATFAKPYLVGGSVFSHRFKFATKLLRGNSLSEAVASSLQETCMRQGDRCRTSAEAV
jgi:hypothetical protein